MGFLYYAVMGNVSGKKKEGESAESSGIKNQEHGEEEYMEYGLFPDSMVQSPPHSPKAYHHSPLDFTPQVRGDKCYSIFLCKLGWHYQDIIFFFIMLEWISTPTTSVAEWTGGLLI